MPTCLFFSLTTAQDTIPCGTLRNFSYFSRSKNPRTKSHPTLFHLPHSPKYTYLPMPHALNLHSLELANIIPTVSTPKAPLTSSVASSMKWDSLTYCGGSNSGMVKGMDCEVPSYVRPWAAYSSASASLT